MCVVRVCRLCLYKMAKRQLTRNIFRSLYSASLCFDSCRWFGDWWIYLWLFVQPLNWQRTLPLAPIDSEQQSRLYSHCHVRRTTHTHSRRWNTQQRQRTLEIIEQTKSQFIMRLLKTHNFLFRHSRKTTNRSEVNSMWRWNGRYRIHMPHSAVIHGNVSLKWQNSCGNRNCIRVNR